MNIKAKLFVCGEERELIATSLNYIRLTDWNGKPTSALMGGAFTATFKPEMYDDTFIEWIIADRKDNKKIRHPFNLYLLRDGKVVFYEDDFDGVELFQYNFQDGVLINYHEVFDNQKGMYVTLTISPAMQDYRFFNNSTDWRRKSPTRYIKPWQESFIPPIEETPYKAQENKEPKKEKYFVEKIEIESLDEGSDNGGTNKKEGLIHGKEYALKVAKYKNDKAPKDSNTIKWSYGYTNAKEEVVVGNINQKGDKVIFKANDLDYCGNKITFYAYIENKENEAELEVFHHYRFRWFDRKVVERQIEERVKKPWRINQGGTSLCGMACLFYLFAKKDKQGYKKLAETLHRTGKALHNGYTVEPDEDAKEEMYNTNPITSKKHPWIPEIDWITMATTRSKESDFGYTGKRGQDASAINWPWLMTKLGKKLLGYKTVEMDYYKINKSYIRDFFGSDEKIRILEEDIDKDYKNGYEICMMIDADMMYNKADYDITDFGEYHWVTYEGALEILNSKRNTESDYDKVTGINFNVVTWGEFKRDKGSDKKKLRLSKASFRNNYYGYLKLK
ncbi:hypothetical protein C7448_10682 [Tenacibaculum gallaicum]|uniref:Uncharacterized protein n=1 Tax=Tenacibaculum gallaicum TaxID=561505 RepID=A0A3E0HM17_9FLAO|nr:type VI secretion system tube protein TssD [Tenacibaculum gallaicum]REH47461.1 hypothetical protein C7448_10682 [Tenacibaculum gallaicum]